MVRQEAHPPILSTASASNQRAFRLIFSSVQKGGGKTKTTRF